jgi:hypothetical protein
LTWESLQPLINAILALITPPVGAKDAGERIRTVAETALGVFGWGAGPVTPSSGSLRIAAAICADPSDPARPRQGGISLLSIFQIAGAKGVYFPRCTTITQAAVAKWQEVSPEATDWRNKNDLPAWCGIFCYYVYRCAGINLGGWVNHDNNVQNTFRKFGDPGLAFRGCIGVEDGVRKEHGRNHHFLVMDNQDKVIRSIDGNCFGPVDGDYSTGLKSVIARKTYTHARLRKDSVYFLFPSSLLN